jgi:hypothetical protein
VSTPEEQPSPNESLARAHAARAKMAAALDEDQEPEADEPLGWSPAASAAGGAGMYGADTQARPRGLPSA